MRLNEKERPAASRAVVRASLRKGFPACLALQAVMSAPMVLGGTAYGQTIPIDANQFPPFGQTSQQAARPVADDGIHGLELAQLVPGTNVSTPPASTSPTSPVSKGASGIGGPSVGQAVPNPAYASINRLNLRGVINVPTVDDTAFGDMSGFKEKLASYGFGITGLLAGSFEQNLLSQPQTTRGIQRYVGQQTEVDENASYLGLTYDLGHVGLPDGLFTLEGCTVASNYGIYPHGTRMCAAYVDQPFYHKIFDVQVGYILNQYQYANLLVGGSVASGSVGPSGSVLTELGLSVGGIGAPGINFTTNLGDFYNRLGVQRASSPTGYVYEGQVANRYGIQFNGIGSRALIIDEAGYRHLASATTNYTWVRLGGVRNFSEFTPFEHATAKHETGGMYLLADHQFIHFDASKPRRGIYAGASYLYADPSVFAYPQYYEGRVYGIGLLPSRPRDQLTLDATITTVSDSYRAALARQGFGASATRHEIYNFTVVYGFHVARGIILNGGLSYGPDPSVIYTPQQGNPLLFRMALAIYL